MNAAKESGQAKTHHPPTETLVVKSGGQQWVVGGELGGSSFPGQGPMEDNRQASRSSLAWLDVVKLPLRGWWHPLQTRVIGSLDRLLQQTSTRSTDMDAKGRSRSRGKFFHYIQDSFQTGLIVGLALGCVSLVLFHQMNAGTAGQTPLQTTTAPAYPGYGVATVGITVPGVRLFALQNGTFSTLTGANAALAHISKLGMATSVHRIYAASGQTSYALLSDVSIYATDLGSVKNRLTKLGIPAKVTSLSWNAQEVPVHSFAQNRALADSISHWLAADVSALNALTASLSDGAAARDATTAFKYSASIQPSQSEIESLSQSSTYLTLGTLTEQAFAKAASGQRDAAVHLVLEAYEQVQLLFANLPQH